MLFKGKGEFDVAEAALYGFSFREVGGAELPAPYDIVVSVEGDVYVEAVGLGFDTPFGATTK